MFKAELRAAEVDPCLKKTPILRCLKEEYLPQFTKIVEDMYILYSQEDMGAPIMFFNESQFSSKVLSLRGSNILGLGLHHIVKNMFLFYF